MMNVSFLDGEVCVINYYMNDDHKFMTIDNIDITRQNSSLLPTPVNSELREDKNKMRICV